MIEAFRSTVRVLLATTIVRFCEAIDEDLARWSKKRIAKQRTKTGRGSRSSGREVNRRG